MRFFGAITLVLPLCAAAQTAIPTINPLGIVRGDTARPGLLAPGIAFGIWGHGYGPKAGCKGPATEVCGVQVLLDGAPIELDYTNDVQINARMPDGVGAAVSKLVVVSGGLRSEPTEVRRLPEVAVISLDGVARVDGPVWIHVELPGRQGVSYPPLSFPWDFACESFEVRKDGKLLAPSIPHPQIGMGYSGPSCPGLVGLSATNAPSRLPLHLQYNLAESGTYEVRLSHYGDFGRRPGDIRSQSAWTKITVLPAGPVRAIDAHPQEPMELVRDFLPDLLARRDDAALEVMLEYLYHPSPRVREYAANALYYWPDTVVEPRLLAMLKADGPSPGVIQRIKGHDSELAEAAEKYLSSDDPVLFEGAIRAAGAVLAPASSIGPELRLRVEQRVMISAGTGNLPRADAQMRNDLIAVLGQIHNNQAHDLLWSLAGHHIGTEEALIAIAWQKDPEDLPRLADYLIAVPAEGDLSGGYVSVPAMLNNFGDAALPWLREVMEEAQRMNLRMDCAEELLRVSDPAAFAFALDVFEHYRYLNSQVRAIVNNQFPPTRNLSDAGLEKFLSAHAK